MILSLALEGCSDRIMTESFLDWQEGPKPWFIGQQTGPRDYTLASGADRALIFEIGDGVQGFPGRITGVGTSSRDISDIIKSCSREDMHMQRGYHGFAVIIRSSDADLDTVECVRRFTSRRFSAGYGRANGWEPFDTTPFQQLESNAD